jgi:FlaA1/EpsC-like NDP-sugar epimerase
MSRYLTRGLQTVADLSVLSIAYWLAFLFRFEFSIPSTWLQSALVNWPFVVAIQYCTLGLFGVLRMSWRYIGMREILRIGFATGASAAFLLGFRIAAEYADFEGNLFVVPISVIVMGSVLGFVGLAGARATRRLQGEAQERRRRTNGTARKRALLVGAGQAGVLVAREIANRPDLGLDPVGFIDDDIRKVGTRISGLPVLGTTRDILEIAERKRAKRVLITIANAAGSEIRRITLQCKDAGLDTKIIPGLYEIVGDRINLSRIRDVAIEDLLGREPVRLDEEQVDDSVRGHTVLVTGAGGSIGSELCRQVARFAPSKLVLVERFENALFEIHRELTAAFPDLDISPQIADVCDGARMERVFAVTRPRVVFHAAAHKHVPMMEHNPGEALKNNIGGTRTVARISDKYGVEQFVLVSTDKAVNPSSIMGASKRVAELVCQACAQHSKTRFVTVRFGNVLGSNGSVIPIFKQQIAAGGPVTVTHPDMQRYFMTIPEAAQLVMQAGAMGQGGEVFILDMGRPVKIVDLAKDLITLSGFRPGEDIDIAFTGVRPGEKLFEELSTGAESADKTKHPKIFIGHVAVQAAAEVNGGVDHLLAIANDADLEAIRTSLRKLVPEYQDLAATSASPDAAPSVAEPETRTSTRRSASSATLPAPAVS